MSSTILYLRSSAVWGGAERQLLALAQATQRSGWQPHLAVLYRGAVGGRAQGQHALVARARRAGLAVTQIADLNSFSIHSLQAVGQLIEQIQPILLHSYDYKTDLLACWFSQWHQIPWIATANGYVAADRKLVLYEKLDRLALRCAAQVITVSGAVKRDLLASGLPERRVQVIHNALIGSAPGDPVALRAAWGVPEGAELISAVGRLSPEKGHRTFLEAARLVQMSRPAARFWLVGSGDLERELRSQAAEYGLEQVVQFLGQQADAGAAMQASDVIVLPSYREAFGVVLLEAMALGKPVVASRVGGIPEIVQHEESGLLVAPGDPEAMAYSILRLVECPDLRRRLGNRGRQEVTQRFSAGRMSEEVIAQYDRILKNHAFSVVAS